ncbi:inner membrane protein YiaH [Andreesenia angusta]|uniref:Inner membrane protein YiaH n=1 Tax=Andreesenia angusta TaxID=39480 RepID=A0A1S1V956_9FIRM|nr:acyltransferase [Andreesenia angusta]OHW63136.1 inner membrane protein YiaH [Andreesenia angusta]
MEKKDKLIELDVLRAILCICVLLIHITAPLPGSFEKGTAGAIVSSYINASIKFAVPCFIAVSGFVMSYVYGKRTVAPYEFYRKRLPNIVFPYLVWSGVYTALLVYRGELSLDIKTALYNLSTGRAMYHLYFMVLLIGLYLLFPFLSSIYARYSPVVLTALLVAVNLVYFSVAEGVYSHVNPLKYIGFFATGMFMAKGYNQKKELLEKWRKPVVAIGIMLTIYYCISVYYSQYYNEMLPFYSATWLFYAIFSFFMYLALSSIIERNSGKSISVMTEISKESFVIYLSHPLLLILLGDLYPEGYSELLKAAFNTVGLALIYSVWIWMKRVRRVRSSA